MQSERNRNINKTNRQKEKVVYLSTFYFALLFVFVLGIYIGSIGSDLFAEKSEATKKISQEKSWVALNSNQNINTLSPELSVAILKQEKIVENAPEDAKAWVKLGHLYFDADLHEKTIFAYEKSLALLKEQSDVYTDLGTMYRMIHKHEQAIICYDLALSIDPKFENALLNKGIVLFFDFNKKEEAVKIWKELLTINPEKMLSNGQLLSDFMKKI